VRELYSVPLGGPASGIKLNGILAAGGDVLYFQISPDNSRVVYTADQQTDEVIELYSVPIGGPAASGIKLNGILAAGGDVSLFRISPDSSRVVYTADQQTDEVIELYSVPIGGPAAGIKLNGVLRAGGFIDFFKISLDSNRVVYITPDQEPVGGMELFSVPIGGPAASGIKLNGDLTAGGDVMFFPWLFRISADSSRVFYVADQDTDEVLELYMTSFDDTPDPFAFTDLIGVPLNAAMISNPITVSGINTGTNISISGGEYSINGMAYTFSPGMVNNGDRITVRLTSSNSCSTSTGATLTIGGVSDTFNVTTIGLILLYLPLILN
ncbi:MAG: hypothetical protein HY892_08880, partial [Deltaproteobacteria bacterium]|nr:hypothetical protein [Deltaproteobacteria bacterium]